MWMVGGGGVGVCGCQLSVSPAGRMKSGPPTGKNRRGWMRWSGRGCSKGSIFSPCSCLETRNKWTKFFLYAHLVLSESCSKRFELVGGRGLVGQCQHLAEGGVFSQDGGSSTPQPQYFSKISPLPSLPSHSLSSPTGRVTKASGDDGCVCTSTIWGQWGRRLKVSACPLP